MIPVEETFPENIYEGARIFEVEAETAEADMDGDYGCFWTFDKIECCEGTSKGRKFFIPYRALRIVLADHW